MALALRSALLRVPRGLGRFSRRGLSSSAAAPSLFKGVWPIMATPFHPDESLDLDGFANAIRFMASAGADGVTVVGVLGESNRITDEERVRLVTCAVEAAESVGRPFPVCVGTSHSGTAATVALSQMAQELGASAVMVTPSKEASGNWDDALLTLYARVAAGCPGLPIVLQDHPASTQVHMPVPLLAKIVAEVPSISCIKLESLPTPAKIAALRAIWAKAPPAQECTILSAPPAAVPHPGLDSRGPPAALIVLTPSCPLPHGGCSRAGRAVRRLRHGAGHAGLHDRLRLP
jgi:dihydrodipicolinate synthase/N-acetylneuraminate lyase